MEVAATRPTPPTPDHHEDRPPGRRPPTGDTQLESTSSTAEPSVSQQQAIDSAQSYLETGGFSRVGLIQQLSSKSGEGFTHAEAVYAVQQLHPDWNAQAVKSAKSYLESGGFSRTGLIEQLSVCAR